MIMLYSGMTCPFSHSTRIVLQEKGCEFEITDVDMYQPIDVKVSALSPYGEVPILQDRDLVLFNARVINEYLDERFPHPQLMPAGPTNRARARLFLYLFEREIFTHVRTLEAVDLPESEYEKARNTLRDQLTLIALRLNTSKYMMGDEYSLLDISMAPVLWRLSHWGIEMPRSAAPIMTYGERLFARPAFIESMTPNERVMRR